MDLLKIIPDKIETYNDSCILDKEIFSNKLLIKFIFKSNRKSSLEIKRFVDDKIFFFGLGLFAGEGTKRRKSGVINKDGIEIINSDPVLINCFLDFLEQLGFEKWKCKARIQISCSGYEKLQFIKESTKFWQSVTNIPIENFNSPNIRIKKNPKQKSKNGSMNIRLFSIPLCRLMEFWIKNIESL